LAAELFLLDVLFFDELARLLEDALAIEWCLDVL
jgi:hypothetical protein